MNLTYILLHTLEDERVYVPIKILGMMGEATLDESFGRRYVGKKATKIFFNDPSKVESIYVKEDLDEIREILDGVTS